jgi:flagellin-like protein
MLPQTTGTEHSQAGDRGVSPVIGVILMTAITVIMAAVIGTFVLNLGGSVQENVQAGISVEHVNGNDEVKVTWTSNQNADSIDLHFDEEGAGVSTAQLTSVGETETYTCASDGSRVEVTATGVSDDTETVLTTDDIDDC